MNSSSGQAAKKKATSSQPSEPSFKRKRGMFQKDLQHMMYGFGDDPNPLPETVALVEDIVVEYITDIASQPLNNLNNELLRNSVVKQAIRRTVMGWVTSCEVLVAHKAQEFASKRGKLLTEDFLYLMRKDLPKLHRCTELLSMNEELKQARKAFEVDEDKLANVD